MLKFALSKYLTIIAPCELKPVKTPKIATVTINIPISPYSSGVRARVRIGRRKNGIAAIKKLDNVYIADDLNNSEKKFIS